MHVFELFLELKLYFLSFLRLQKTYFDYFKKLELGGPFGGLGLPPVKNMSRVKTHLVEKIRPKKGGFIHPLFLTVMGIKTIT